MSELDVKHCVNCCADLDDKENESENAFYSLNCSSRVLPQPKNSRATCVERVSVHDALSKIFNFEPFQETSQTASDSTKRSKRIDQSSLPICFVCHLVLNDLYRTYTEFNQLRKANSYLNRKLKCGEDSNGRDSRGDTASKRRKSSVLHSFSEKEELLPVPLDVKVEVFESEDEEEEEGSYEPGAVEYPASGFEFDRQEDSNLSVQIAKSVSSYHSSNNIMLNQPSKTRTRRRRYSQIGNKEKHDAYSEYSSFSNDPHKNNDDTDIDPLDLLETVDSDAQDQESSREDEMILSSCIKNDRTNTIAQQSDDKFYLLSPDGTARLFGLSVTNPPVNCILSSRIGKDGTLKINYRDHYDFPSGVGEGKATCRICHQIVARKKCSTASMRSHLFRKHKMRFPQIAPYDTKFQTQANVF